MEFKQKVRITGHEVKQFTDNKGEEVSYISINLIDSKGNPFRCTALNEIGVEAFDKLDFSEINATFSLSVQNGYRLKLKLVALS